MANSGNKDSLIQNKNECLCTAFINSRCFCKHESSTSDKYIDFPTPMSFLPDVVAKEILSYFLDILLENR